MSTATQIKYNEKGQNNIFPDDSAASFVDGSLKAGSAELDRLENVDFNLVDNPDFYVEDGTLKPVNQYGNSELVCVWTQNNQSNYSTIAQPFETNNVTIVNGFASMTNGDTNLTPDFIVGSQVSTYEFDMHVVSNDFTRELFRMSDFSKEYIVLNFKKAQSGNDILELMVEGVDQVDRYYSHEILSGLNPGEKHNIAVTYIAKQGTQNGKLYLYLNGAVIINQTIDYDIDFSDFNRFKFKQQNEFRFKNFRFENSDKYQGANFTPIETLPQKPFKESHATVFLKTFDRSINQISTFNFVGSTNVRFTAQDQRFANTSQTWVDSTMTYAQSTIMSIARQNISTLEMNTPDVKIDLHFPESNIQEYATSLDLNFKIDYFQPIVNLTTMGTSIYATELVDFEYKAFDEEGCYIFVWLIVDGEWFYFNESTQAWEPSDKSLVQANTLPNHKKHISKFEFNNTIKKLDHSITLYLPIDPTTGTQSLQSPSVEWIAYEYGQHNVELPPPHETTLIGLARDVGTNVSTDHIRVSRTKSMIYPSTIVKPDYWDIKPDDAVGSFSKGLYETETINECYRFDQSYQVVNRRTEEIETKYDLIGFSVYPKTDKIRLDDLPLGKDENECKQNFAIWVAAGRPQPVPNDLFSQCDNSNVSGDCLIEYVNELIGGAGVAGLFRGTVGTTTQVRANVNVSDGDYVQNLETQTIWAFDQATQTWSDTTIEFGNAELEALVQAIATRAPADRNFRGVLKDYSAIEALQIETNTDYVHNAETQTVWQYDVTTNDWYDTGVVVDISANTVAKIDFENVTTVVASYATYINRPIVEIWVLEDNINQTYAKVEADVDYNTDDKLVSVDFNGSFETGYLILS